MDVNFNVTYITFGGHVEVDKYRYLYFVIMLTAYVLIICSNSTIVYIISTHQNLHEPMYVFIAALLINSVLWSITLYPKLLIDFLSEKQIISYSACLFQFHLFYSLGGSEFLLLAAMAYDRYVSICKPLKYSTIMRKSTVSTVLGFAWILPACLVMLTTASITNEKLCHFILNAVYCNNIIYKLHCVVSKTQFIQDMIIMVIVVLLPLLFILFTYTRILIVSCQRNREVQRKAAQTCLPHVIVLLNFSCLGVFDIVRVADDFSKTVRLVMSLQIMLYHPLFNPIIYGIKMKEISKHLKRLFRSDKKKHQHR